MEPSKDPRRADLMQKAVDAWGTGIIFERRAKIYQAWLKACSLVGFAMPIVVGVLVIALGADWAGLKQLLYWVGIVAAVQALFNGFMIFNGFEEKLRTAQDSASLNKALAPRCEALAKDVKLADQDFEIAYASIRSECAAQEAHDEKKGITAKERRRGGRHGLRRFGLPCSTCRTKPASDSAKKDGSTCQSCGDF